MVFGELLFAVFLFGVIAIGFRAMVGAFEASTAKRRNREFMERERSLELKSALMSHDHRRVEDWLAVYGSTSDEATLKRVQTRRDELYIESDDTSPDRRTHR